MDIYIYIHIYHGFVHKHGKGQQKLSVYSTMNLFGFAMETNQIIPDFSKSGLFHS